MATAFMNNVSAQNKKEATREQLAFSQSLPLYFDVCSIHPWRPSNMRIIELNQLE